MKVLVAGATGVLGRPAVRALVGAGHRVTGLARSPGKAALLERLGAHPAAADLFDPHALDAAVAGHDAVVNLATRIPPVSRAALPGAWDENARIRTEGAANLARSALAAGVGRYVQESITFNYPDCGDDWITEDVAVSGDGGVTAPALAAEAAAQRVTDGGGAGIVLRFGSLYGAESDHSRAHVRAARHRLPAVPGPDGAFVSPVHADDAAAAVVAALALAPGTYNVVDDRPVTRAELHAVLAGALGVRPPHRAAAGLAARLGGARAAPLLRSHRVSNRRLRDAAGWAPRYPSVAEGLPPVVAALTGGVAARA